MHPVRELKKKKKRMKDRGKRKTRIKVNQKIQLKRKIIMKREQIILNKRQNRKIQWKSPKKISMNSQIDLPMKKHQKK